MRRIPPPTRDLDNKALLRPASGQSRQMTLHPKPGHLGRDAPGKAHSWTDTGVPTGFSSRSDEGGSEGDQLVN